MSRLATLRPDPGRPWILPYLTAGWPTLAETPDLVAALEEGGADAVELGMPFSDPLADGPVIQRASQEALAAGASLAGVLEAVTAIRRRSGIPLVLMGYLNPILAYGPERFFTEAAEAGADGLILPDVPVEEAPPYRDPAVAAGLDWIALAAPTSSDRRLAAVDAASTAFSYCVAVTGITGARDRVDDAVGPYLRRVAAVAAKPFVVGFGISRPEHVAAVCPPAAGAVVGSALIAALAEEPDADARRRRARSLVAGLRA